MHRVNAQNELKLKKCFPCDNIHKNKIYQQFLTLPTLFVT